MNHLKLSQAAKYDLVCAGDRAGALEALDSDINLTGRLVVQHFRGGKRINEYHFTNGITNEGKNRLLSVMFNQGTQIGTWYLGLIDNVGYSALADTDTYDDIDQAANGWDEFKNYTDGNNGDNTTTRPEWQEDAPSGQAITNSTVAVFNVTGSGTVKGVFLVGGIASANLKGDHATGGVLWATALFNSGDVPVQNGDQLKVTYTVSA
jgi:hypothetical protein